MVETDTIIVEITRGLAIVVLRLSGRLSRLFLGLRSPAGGSARPKIVVLFGLALLRITFSGFAYYRNEKDAILAEQSGDLAAIASLKVDALLAWRRNGLVEGRELSANPLFVKAADELRAGHITDQTGSGVLNVLSIVRSDYNYASVSLVDARGSTVVSTPSGIGSLQPATRDAVLTSVAGGDTILTDLYSCAACGHPQLDVVSPIDDTQGHPSAAVVLTIDPGRYLYPMLEQWPGTSPTAETILVRRDGDSILCLNDLRHQAGTALSLRLPLSRPDLPAVQAVLGKQGMVLGKDYRGVEVLADLRPVPGTPWFLVTEVDAAEALSGLQYRAWVTFVFVLLVALAAGVGTALIYWRREAGLFRRLLSVERREKEELKRFRTVLYSIGDAVIGTDGAGRIQEMNPQAERLTGWSEPESQGKSLGEIFHLANEDTRAEVENPVCRVLAERNVVGLANHTLLIARDGREYPIADSAAPIHDPSGDMSGVVLVFRDQTDERTARRSLLAEKRKAEQYFEAAGVLMVALDLTGNVLAINQSGCELLGVSREEAVGENWLARFLPAGERERAELVFSKVTAADAETRYVENLVLCRDSEERLIGWHNAALRDEDGVVMGTLSSGEDVTDRRRAEAELQRNELHFRSLVKILQHPAESVAEVLEIAMEEAVRLTESGIGHLFQYSEERKEFLLSLRSKGVEELCSISNQTEIRRIEETGFLGEAVRSRQPVMVNDYSAPDPCKKGYPEMHPPIHRYLAVPVIRRDRVVAVIGVANKPTEYDKGDVEQLSLLMDAIWTAVERLEMLEEKDRMAAQLIQAQKMESIGLLAGGVAHDFNNMLGVIIGHAEIARDSLEPDHPAHASVREILKAADRSSDLTLKLLAFARRQIISPRAVDLSRVVGDMLSVLERLIGENVDLRWVLEAGLWQVWVDPSQIEQLLANLVVNARDAIPGHGSITIRTANAVLDADSSQSYVGMPSEGEYVLVAIEDTGVGISEEILPHIFEPFFTTKPLGKGTGLGLATVYGIVKQNNGYIYVESVPNRGTTFNIYLPRSQSEAVQSPERTAAERSTAGDETILIVEDEKAILRLSSSILTRDGYRVLTASTPGDAIALVEKQQGEIHLLITDVVMPEMNGEQLRDCLTALKPGLKTLFMSGYAADIVANAGVLAEGIDFIHKPFSAKALRQVVRALLDKERPNE